VQIGGDLRLADGDPRSLAALVMPVSVNQPHMRRLRSALGLGFFKQLTVGQAYPSQLLDATMCAKITPC
jgi:hypothetical protein